MTGVCVLRGEEMKLDVEVGYLGLRNRIYWVFRLVVRERSRREVRI